MTNVSTHPSPSAIRYGDPDFLEAYGQAWGAAESILTFFGTDAVYEDKSSGVVIRGHEMMRRFMRVYLRFSPQCVVTFTRAAMGPTSFAAEWHWTGTDDSPLRLPDCATPGRGAPFDVPGMSFCTLNADGLIASHTDYWDAATLIRQVNA